MTSVLKWILFAGGIFNGFIGQLKSGMPAIEFHLIGISCLLSALFLQREAKTRRFEQCL